MKRKWPFVLVLVLTVSLLACSLFGQSVTIAENERGVVADEQGKLQVLGPGTHALSPFIQSVEVYSLADQTYTMTEQPTSESAVQGNDVIEARSKDGRTLRIDAAVTFRFVESS
jgi:regulator of protease activity HflC (stomatin/prohibitin superfamily)